MSAIYTPSSTSSSVITALASGAITKGAPVSINSDGTVSTTGYSNATPSTYGGNLPQGNTNYVTPVMSSAHDPVSGATVLAYTNSAGQGEAVVCTVGAGTSLTATFGTPVVFDIANCYQYSVVFDTVNSKFVIVYYLAGAGMKAIVGTVTGSTISFGTSTVIESITATSSSACFDSSTVTIVVSYGVFVSTVRAAVGTISGTTITFGTIAIVDAATTLYQINSISFNASAGKVLIYYGDVNTVGYCIVGTVAITTISFGTRLSIGAASFVNSVYDSLNLKNVLNLSSTFKAITITGLTPSLFAQTSLGIAVPNSSVFDSTNNKIIVSTNNGSISQVFYVTLTGTTFSTTSAVPYFYPSSSLITSVSWNLKYGKVLLFDGFSSASNYVTVGVGSNSTKFIGFASATVANGINETVNVIGGVNSSQTALSTSNKYYVQVDGSLSTTQGSTGVYAGTALSASKILVKG
jgi:hypothetical protein